MNNINTLTWTVKEKRPEAAKVWSLTLQPEGERPTFSAGQYVTVLLPGHEPAEGKAYSLSSPPSEETVRITVKEMGPFSSAVLALAPGSTVTTSAPYGFFYPEPEDVGELVFISGGIGITPIASILAELAHARDTRSRYLFYANRTPEDVVFSDMFFKMAETVPEFSFHSHVTRVDSVAAPHQLGRFTPADILGAVRAPSDASFFICGSIGFNQSVWVSLKAAGVAPEQMFTEGFF